MIVMLSFKGLFDDEDVFGRTGWERNRFAEKRVRDRLPQEKVEANSSSSSATSVTNVGAAYGTIDSMSVTHRSRTGKVLVIATMKVDLESADDNVLDVKLQKDGADVSTGSQSFGGTINTPPSQRENLKGTVSIVHFAEGVGTSTWRVQGKVTATGGMTHDITDRKILVVDLV